MPVPCFRSNCFYISWPRGTGIPMSWGRRFGCTSAWLGYHYSLFGVLRDRRHRPGTTIRHSGEPKCLNNRHARSWNRKGLITFSDWNQILFEIPFSFSDRYRSPHFWSRWALSCHAGSGLTHLPDILVLLLHVFRAWVLIRYGSSVVHIPWETFALNTGYSVSRQYRPYISKSWSCFRRCWPFYSWT